METRGSLFIVAPDANAATLKKLRGIGVATGTGLIAVQSITDLAMPPPAFSTLLIPEYIIDQGYLAKDWHRVFEISQSPHILHARSRNVIAPREPLTSGHDSIQIVNLFIRHFFDGAPKNRWFAIHSSWVLKAQQITPQLKNWMAHHHIAKTSKISALIKSLDALEQMVSSGSMNQRERHLDVLLDTKNFEIQIEMPCPNPFDADRLQKTFAGVDANLMTFTKLNDSMIVKIQLSLSIANENSFIVFSQNSQSDSIGARPAKEAS